MQTIGTDKPNVCMDGYEHNPEPLLQGPAPAGGSDIFLSVIVCLGFTLVFVWINPRALHWSLIPLFVCGMVVGVDMIGWIRSRFDVFDPKGIIGALGLYFFFISPLLFIIWEIDIPYIQNPSDWRPWYGLMACFNLVGLAFYNFFQNKAFKKASWHITKWEILPSRVMIVAPIAFVLALVGQTVFLAAFGGWRGIIEGREYGFATVVRGMGPFMILGHSLPPLFLITLTVMTRSGRALNRRTNIFVVFILLVFFLVFQLYVSGLHGSRSVIAWGLFWAVGIIHFFWRRVTLKWVLISLIPFLLFMYLYGFYKILGERAFDLFRGQATVKELEAESKRSFTGLLLGDLSRADMQALITYTLVSKYQEYDYRYGKTYLFSAMAYVPYWILGYKPHNWSKIAAGTEIQFGKGYYVPYDPARSSTKVYGLAGEAMLNFGPLGIPVVFSVWGYLVGKLRRRLYGAQPGDAFLLLIPIFCNLAFVFLVSDSDNLFYFLIDKILIPFFVVRCMCIKRVVSIFDDVDYHVTMPLQMFER